MSSETDNLYSYDNEFRDKLSTVDSGGKRIWIYPKKPRGRYHNSRIIVSVILLLLLFSGPLIRVNGHAFMLFDIINRKFIIFGVPFWPQDFIIFVLALITFVVFIVLFTVVFGRVWCGWACPQTIFMEMVFRKIEYWIEGDAGKQRKLEAAPWNSDKIFKKSLKHILFILISLLIAHTLMAYLVGMDELEKLVSHSPMENPAGFAGLIFFSGMFYFVFAFFREQACTVVCPYGRLQGVFLGKNSIAVMYDWLRGEPRGRIKKNESPDNVKKGDCIDCKMCVHVCPTGIDIRNGTQLECVNCTACMDACDDVMVKVKRPKGLIRYASYSSISESKKNLFTTRVMGYSAVLTLLISLLVYFLASRSPVETTVLRVPGTLYQEQENGMISNLYNIQFINKTFVDKDLQLKLENYANSDIRKVGESRIHVPANGDNDGIFFIDLPRTSLHKMKSSLTIDVIEDGKIIDKVKTTFFSPMQIR